MKSSTTITWRSMNCENTVWHAYKNGILIADATFMGLNDSGEPRWKLFIVRTNETRQKVPSLKQCKAAVKIAHTD